VGTGRLKPLAAAVPWCYIFRSSFDTFKGSGRGLLEASSGAFFCDVASLSFRPDTKPRRGLADFLPGCYIPFVPPYGADFRDGVIAKSGLTSLCGYSGHCFSVGPSALGDGYQRRVASQYEYRAALQE
jgi:hypothetical protein